VAQIRINLQANKPQRQTFGQARFLAIFSVGVAASVDVKIEVAGFAQEELRGLKARDRIEVPDGFEAVSFVAAVDCTIEVIASMIDVRLNNDDGAIVSANIVGTVPVQVTGPNPLPVQVAAPSPLPVFIDSPNPVPVSTNRGQNAAAPLYVSGAVLGDTPAATLTDNAKITAGPVAVAVLAADATRLETIIYNIGPDPVALGMVGITWAKRAIVLQAGDTWLESRGASKAWYAITDAGKTADVTTQERKA